MPCNRKCRCIVNRPDNARLKFVAAGADGVVFVDEERDVAKKVFYNKKYADKEAFCLHKLDESGVAPHFKEYIQDSVYMENLGREWMQLDDYIESLGVSCAPVRVQESLLKVFHVMDESSINPSDYRADNFMVNPTTGRVVRIDFARAMLTRGAFRGASTFLCNIAPWFPMLFEQAAVGLGSACELTKEQLLQLVSRRERLRGRNVTP